MAAELHVVCLCAQWCGTCRDWQPLMDQVAQSHPQMGWRWLDIEDDAELLDDLDVETLPTLLVARGDQVLFYGPVLPKLELLSRLLETFTIQSQGDASITDEVMALWQRLRG